jgi:uncharacterized protein (DUF362 family)
MTERMDGQTRRDFLARIGRAAGAAAGVGALGVAFHHRNPTPSAREAVDIPSYLVPGTESRLVVAEGTDPAAAVRAALEELGGIGRYVKRGERVLIKPNCAFDRPPHLGATSSPEVVGETVRQCVGAGAVVRVIDNPINDPEGCFVKSGLMDAVRSAGGDVWLPSPDLFGPVRVGPLRLAEWDALARPLQWADKVIGVPTVKTHNLCSVSLAMKNWYGLLGGPRNRLHQAIHEVIADLGHFLRPTLIVLDGSRLLIRHGPTGGSPADVAPGNTVAIGTDAVAVDAVGAGLLSVRPEALEFLRLAERRGLGVSDPTALSLYRTVRAPS